MEIDYNFLAQSEEALLPSSQTVSPPPPRAKSKPCAQEHREMVALKRKVRDLKRALSSQHSDSLANLLALMAGDKGEAGGERLVVQSPLLFAA